MSKLIDDEGENQAVRMFLALYGGSCGVTAEQMRKHLKMAGFDGAWPEWASAYNGHLTKAGAQLWIRHMFALAEQPPVQQDIVAWGKPSDEMVQAATDEYDEWANDNKGTTECIRAILVKALAAAPQPAQCLPDAITDKSEHLEYISGWNDCRQAMLLAQAVKTAPLRSL